MKPAEPTQPARTAEDATLLRQALLAMQQMQAKLDVAERRNTEPIAIVGLACRFPGGVVDGESFWELLSKGRNAIREVPSDRWDVDAYFDPDPDKPGKMVSRWGGFLDSVADFDATFFGVSPREAAAMDPQQRLALEVAWETLENAAIAPASLQGTKTGVFLGIASGDYSQLVMESGDTDLLDVHHASGVAHSIASGRISYLLGLEGPSVSLDTACSSSLVAVHLACQSLRTGDCNLALAGGVNLMLAPQTTALLSRVRMLCPDGRCKAFDDSADGFVRGEGCGFLALKRLSQAQADGNRILAVIRGTAANQDGASSSLTAPNGPSQIALMRQTLANAGVSPEQVSFVEAHGTGTALGDPIELQSLGAVYGAAIRQGDTLQVGSLKTNLGHLEAAAGVAGLIKAVLAVQHRAIPPNLNFTRPTSHVDWKKLRLSVPTQLMDWRPASNGGSANRFAAVSSFGFSGTNAHVVLEEATDLQRTSEDADQPVSILAVSAKSAAALQRSIDEYRRFLDAHPETNLRDFCFTANTGRSHFSHRGCFLASDLGQLQEQLAAFDPVSGLTSSQPEARICLLYTGQGSQYLGMGKELYETFGVFREAMEGCGRAFRAETGGDLMAALYPLQDGSKPSEDWTETARVAQPALYALEVALTELWRSWGVEPSVLLGHSLGEYAAAVAAGILTVEGGMRLVCARARLMESLKTKGAMRSVAAGVERVRQAIAGYEKEVSIAAVNGPESVVISGGAERIEEIAGRLEQEGIRTRALAVTHAFHSPLLEPMLEEFERTAETVEYGEPRVRIISNRTGKSAAVGEMNRARYWREQMRGTIEFDEGLRTALGTNPSVILEIGPQPHLTALGKTAHPEQGVSWLVSMRRGRNHWADMLAAVQALYVQGAEINWKALHGKAGRPLALPAYPFERTRYWFRAKLRTVSVHAHASLQHPLLGDRISSPLKAIQFESRIAPSQPAFLGDHIVNGHRVVPAAAYLEMALSAAAAVDGRAATALSEITFLRPCVFDSARIVQCTLEEKNAKSTFAIYSCGEDEPAEPWLLHSTGEIALDTSHSESSAIRTSLAELRKRCPQEVASSDFYRVFEERNAGFGPAFRSIARVYCGKNEALAEFVMTKEARDKSSHYRLHPIALDACFQAVVALLQSRVGQDGTIYLPAALESLRILDDPRELAYAHAIIREDATGAHSAQLIADVRGMDGAGRVLIEAEGLVMRPGRQEQLAASADNLLEGSMLEIDWVLAEGGNPRESHIGANCVIAGDELMVHQLSSALAKCGARATTLSRESTRTNPESGFGIQLQSVAGKSTGPISDCFYLAPEIAIDSNLATPELLMQREEVILGQCVSLAQALLGLNQKQSPKLWIVTRGAQGLGAVNFAQSTLWGFGRALAAEHPEMSVTRVDLDPSGSANADKWLEGILANPLEDELAQRGNDIYAPRLRRARFKTAGVSAEEFDAKSNRRLELVRPGTLEGLGIVAGERRDPGPDEVEIHVAAAGLNFRDVLNVLGMYRGNTGPLGGECAGTVVRVGASVTSFRLGDEVVAIGHGCFAQFGTTHASMVWHKPARLSFEAAVTIPVAFLTAWHALHSLASIQRGESVLIHAGAGGVGLAAIQIAQKAGAIVYANAGSPEKRAYLKSIGVENVMDSRSLAFLDELKQATHNRGVDVVLNSLAGKFIDANIAALAPGGRFLEMGVADIRPKEEIARLRPDISYLPFNLAPALETGDSFVGQTLETILGKFQSGELRPLPRKVFPLQDSVQAFRYMAQARHIGRVVIQPESSAVAKGIRKDGAYLVTGGISGIGRAVVERLAQLGAGQVIAMGRSAPNLTTTESFRKLHDSGTIVSMHQGDVANEAEVRVAFDLASLPLRGIFHCAGVLDDGVLLQQNWSRFERVLSPKVQGSWNLHRLSADRPLDHFVLFSSIASIFGSPGQTNYAAANAFLDGLAHYRNQLGLPAISINWGAWSETGAALRHGTVESNVKIGLKGIASEAGLVALSKLIEGAFPQIAIAPMDWARFFAAGPQAGRPFFASLRSDISASQASKAVPPDPSRHTNFPSSWLLKVRAAAPSRRQDTLLKLLEERVQATLGIGTAQAIDPNQPLQEFGLDSLLSIELRNALSASLDRSLPATLLFNYPTLTALARYLCGEVFAEDLASARQNGSSPVKRGASSNLLDEIEALSDGEVEQLLSTKAAGRAK